MPGQEGRSPAAQPGAGGYFGNPLALCSTTAHNTGSSVPSAKGDDMPRLSVQELITPILICAFSFASNAAESIGLAMAKGSFQVDNSQVYGNTTLLEGATIQTEKASSRLQLNNGTRMDLAENSRARIF